MIHKLKIRSRQVNLPLLGKQNQDQMIMDCIANASSSSYKWTATEQVEQI